METSSPTRHFDLNGEDHDGRDETEQPDHSASLGDSVTSSTRIGFWYTHLRGDCTPAAPFGDFDESKKAGGRYAADPFLQLPARGSGSAAILRF